MRRLPQDQQFHERGAPPCACFLAALAMAEYADEGFEEEPVADYEDDGFEEEVGQQTGGGQERDEEELRRAAARIQARERGRIARKTVPPRHKKATAGAVSVYGHAQSEAAAVRIQAQMRGRAARSVAAGQKDDMAAAVRIQARVRGQSVRRAHGTAAPAVRSRAAAGSGAAAARGRQPAGRQAPPPTQAQSPSAIAAAIAASRQTSTVAPPPPRRTVPKSSPPSGASAPQARTSRVRLAPGKQATAAVVGGGSMRRDVSLPALGSGASVSEPLAEDVETSLQHASDLELSAAVHAEQQARQRLQRLRAKAQRELRRACSLNAIQSVQERKRREGVRLRAEMDQRVGRDQTQRIMQAEVAPATEEEVRKLSELFNAKLGDWHPDARNFFVLFKHIDVRATRRLPCHALPTEPARNPCACATPRCRRGADECHAVADATPSQTPRHSKCHAIAPDATPHELGCRRCARACMGAQVDGSRRISYRELARLLRDELHVSKGELPEPRLYALWRYMDENACAHPPPSTTPHLPSPPIARRHDAAAPPPLRD